LFDLILRGGTVIDGTNSPRAIADISIRGDRIAAIGDLANAEASRTIDAAGSIVAPGFIDVHNHSDGWLLKHANFWPKTSQGFTTEVLMADGISYAPVSERTWRQWFYYLRSLNGLRMQDYSGWRSIADYMQRLEGRTAQNFATHVPYANVRTLACGFGRAPADDYQMRSIQAEIRRGMEEGAVGLSTGLDYLAQCFSSTDELVAACQAMAPYNGLYVTHIRYKTGLLAGLKEAVEIGRRAGVRVHISHLKGPSEGEVEEVLEYIDKVGRHEVDLSLDVYPYQRGSTMLQYLLPYEVWEEGPLSAIARLSKPEVLARFREGLEAVGTLLDTFRIAWTATWDNSGHHGQPLSEYVAELNLPVEEALYQLLVEESMAVLLVVNPGGEESLVHPILQHDLYMMGSDGIYFPDSAVHPRVFGSAGRLLGPCVRDFKLFSLETAVHKLTGLPAQRFGLRDRGILREGAFADLALFDAETVSDRATYDEPNETCIGIHTVIVNGKPIVEAGKPIGADCQSQPGRYLRYEPQPLP
jgi:N-acyl-D-amino-acid deacylase